MDLGAGWEKAVKREQEKRDEELKRRLEESNRAMEMLGGEEVEIVGQNSRDLNMELEEVKRKVLEKEMVESRLSEKRVVASRESEKNGTDLMVLEKKAVDSSMAIEEFNKNIVDEKEKAIGKVGWDVQDEKEIEEN